MLTADTSRIRATSFATDDKTSAGRRALGDQGGNAPQRGLLGDDPAETFARLGLGDRSRHEPGEVAQVGLDVGPQRLGAGRPGANQPPDLAVDHDRDADLRPELRFGSHGTPGLENLR
jgi:hypothetical protein